MGPLKVVRRVGAEKPPLLQTPDIPSKSLAREARDFYVTGMSLVFLHGLMEKKPLDPSVYLDHKLSSGLLALQKDPVYPAVMLGAQGILLTPAAMLHLEPTLSL